jgi:hypothetical protein
VTDQKPEPAPLAANQIRLIKREYTLTLPASYTVRLEIRASMEHPQRCLAAALALCCPPVARMLRDKDKPKSRGPTYEGCGYNVAKFGGVILDGLHAKGVPLGEIYLAGSKAWDLIEASFVSVAAVEEAEGNSFEEEDD